MKVNLKRGVFALVVTVIILTSSAFILLDKKVEEKSTKESEDKENTLVEAEVDEVEVVEEMVAYPQGYFRNPLDGDIRLSGTFGELRSNHFHGGLDMRTGGVQGKNIYAVADGYVSRVNISSYGYGKAVYIRHPNGYTSVYGHLKELKGNLQKYVEKAQYARKRFAVQLFPGKDVIKVKKGEVIALSGNTGGSGGPHLHFELRSTATEATINPMLFGLKISDKRKPKIRRIFIHYLDQEYKVAMGHYPSKEFTSKGVLQGKTVHLAPGKYGIAALLKDEFLASTERLGVNYMKLFKGEEEIFSTKIETFKFHESRYMNCHIDFSRHKKRGLKTAKMWQDKGNKLRFYKHVNKGIIDLKKEETVKLKLEIKDLAGYSDNIEFYIKGIDTLSTITDIRSFDKSEGGTLCSPYKDNSIVENDFNCFLPKGVLYDDYLFVSKVKDEGKYSKKVTLGSYTVPLHKPITVKIKTRNVPKGKEKKLYIVEYFKGGRYAKSGNYYNGFMKFSTKDLGTFYVAMDTIKPRIKPLNLNPVNPFRFYVSDVRGSGIKSFSATIDGKWFLLDWEYKTGILKGKPNFTLSKGAHKLKLVVTDDCKNTRIFERTINVL